MNPFVRAIVAFVLVLSSLPSSRAASSWDGKAAVDYVLSVEPDRPDALYKQGEAVNFNIELQHLGKPALAQNVNWRIFKDGMPGGETGTLTLKDGRAKVSGSLNEPGFLQCQVTFKDGASSYTANAAAGIDPVLIKPSMPCPADFDEFWAAQKKLLSAVPLNPRLAPVSPPPDRPGVECFDLQADCVGAPVSGYYSRPVGAKPRSHPARLYVDGAGVRDSDLVSSARGAQRGMLSLAINAHGIPNGKPREFYAALATGSLKNYRTDGRESRDTLYFLGMFLRVQRALDFLTAQPEWDGRTLIIEGGSQGGAQAMVGAALDRRVTFCGSLVTALCDHTGMVAGRVPGWPKLVPLKDGVPDPAVLEASRYFDMVNFAPRIKARCYFWVGFLDATANPTTVYAAYNQISAPKEMHHAVSSPHSLAGVRAWNELADAELAHIRRQSPDSPQP